MIESKVKAIMSRVFGVPDDSITTESSNETVARWDSLGHMNLCLAIEEEFGVELNGAQVASMTSYSEVVSTVQAALEK